MAFNPFTAFRKHQKVFFAVLTIICMITFILQFGRGDPFERLLTVIGMRGGRGEEVTKLYGKTIKERDLQELYQQRLLAAGFMTSTAGSSLYEFMKELDKEKSKAQARQDPTPLGGLADRFMRRSEERMPDPARLHRDAGIDLEIAVRATEAPGLEKDAETKTRLEAAAEALAFQTWASSFPPNSSMRDRMFYFGGTGRTADLLDFLIWRHQADQLGIVVSFEDLCKELNRRCGKDLFTTDNFASNVELYLRVNQAKARASNDDLIKALTDEFRVVLAKECILGRADGVPGWRKEFTLVGVTPAAVTPDEFLEYYRQQRTTVAVTMLPLSVARFRKEVTGTPPETTLRRFFDAYQDKEPIPDQRQPGFKEPRRVRLAWFSYSPKEDFYKKKAAKLAGLPPLLRLGAGANNYAAGGGPWLWAVQTATLASDNRYLAAYGDYQQEERRQFESGLGVGFDIKDRRPLLQRPELAAGLTAQLAGSATLGGAAPLMAPLYLTDTAALHAVKTAQSFGSALLAGASIAPEVAVTQPLTFTHTSFPLESVLPRMQEKFEEGLAREIAVQDITELGKEMERIKNPAENPAEVERVLREAAQKYGLQDVHVTKELRSVFQLREDPGADLEKLKAAYDRHFHPQEGQLEFFDIALDGKGVNPPYWGEDLARTGHNFPPLTRPRKDDKRPFTQSALFQVFQEEGRIGETGRTWMFWRIEDKPARVHTFEEVRDEVVEAWKTEQARVLARKEGERIVNDLKERKGSGSDAVRFLREQKGDQLIDLQGVARQVPMSRDILLGGPVNPRRFKPYQLPPKTIAYPSQEMLDKLLAMKQPGDATLVTDRPQMHFYVSVLMDRNVPSVRDFTEIYREPVSPRLGDESTLWQQLIFEKRDERRQKVMEQLRAEAGKVDDQGNLVLPEKIQKRQESSTDSGE